jgi:hypothetical protein
MDYDLGVWVLCNQAIRARSATDTLAHAIQTSRDFYPEHADRVAAPTPPIVDVAGDRWWKVRCENWGG